MILFDMRLRNAPWLLWALACSCAEELALDLKDSHMRVYLLCVAEVGVVGMFATLFWYALLNGGN